MSTGRPMPGSSGTTGYVPMGAVGTDDCATRHESGAARAQRAITASVRMRRNLHALDGLRVPKRNYGTHDDQLGTYTRGSGTARRADRRARARAQAPARGDRDPEGSLEFLTLY